MAIRVYHDRERFTDNGIRHNDASVTADAGESAACCKVDGRYEIDHDPEVLGLQGINELSA